MKRYPLIFLFYILWYNSSSQINILDGTYTSFDQKREEVYQIVGKYVVLNIKKSIISADKLKDTLTLGKILKRSDDLYSFYKDNLGYEPVGGNPLFENKLNIYFGTAGEGGGQGYVGAKGIEVSGFDNMFFGIKNNLNVSRDVIIAYELGRNFFTFSNKVLFPFDLSKNEKNGGFAEGFAGLFTVYAFDKLLTDSTQRELNEVLYNNTMNIQRFRGYINDDSSNPYNTIAKWEKIGVLDPNRGIDGWNDSDPAYPGGVLLTGLIEILGRERLFPKFFSILRNQPDVKTIEDALSNIAYSASFSINKNLVPFFKNVMKFKINPETELKIKELPLDESKLIQDQPILWFLSPFEEISLNLKSTNYLQDSCTYQILIDNKVYSSNFDGKNILKYSLLGNKNEIELNCKLVKQGIVIDSFTTILKKRHNINLFDYRSEFYAFYLSNSRTKSSFKNEKLIMKGLEKDSLCEGLLFFNLVFSRGRDNRLEGSIKNVSRKYNSGDPEIGGLPTSGLSEFGFMGPVSSGGSNQRIGYDAGVGDTINYYNIYSATNSNSFMPADNRKYFMNRVYVKSVGYDQTTELKNFYFFDRTDTDGDGFIDFEDNCPLEKGTNNGCPQITNTLDIEKVKILVYPNPASHEMIVKTQDKGILSIYNMSGHRVFTKEINNQEERISVENYPGGLYFVNLVGLGFSSSNKIMIKHN
jgi:hypothetical protein